MRWFVAGLAVVLACVGCGGDAASPSDAGIDAGGGRDAGADAGSDAGPPRVEWPNAESRATSDPWIVDHHDEIQVMRPRVLGLNFVNARSNDDMRALFATIMGDIREGTRTHGYDAPDAPPFLEYELAYAVDLRDTTPTPVGYPYRNSTLYPREEPVDGYWGFDYERLFTPELAALYGIENPDAPGTYLTLCELSERGLVHEVWIYGDADVPDVGAAEILGIMPPHDATGHRVGVRMDRCAGNGCFDAEDTIPPECTRTLRVGWVNNTRGPGCFLESISHGYEAIGNGGLVPYLARYWHEFAGFDLDVRYGLPFDSWYGLCGGAGCLSYPTDHSVTYTNGTLSGTIDPYVPVCGNAHFPPNARDGYDIVNTAPVMSTCAGYRTAGGPSGGDPAAPLGANDWARYRPMAGDCTGAWLVYWWQSFPGLGSAARDDAGGPMKNWWPFYFY